MTKYFLIINEDWSEPRKTTSNLGKDFELKRLFDGNVFVDLNKSFLGKNLQKFTKHPQESCFVIASCPKDLSVFCLLSKLRYKGLVLGLGGRLFKEV